jgi:hypothetical protein
MFSQFVNNLTFYDLVSGWIPCAMLSTGVWGLYKHHQCGEIGCWRPGHAHPDHGVPVCGRHYGSKAADPREP